ncbi:MAG: BamA/TamA family outer membrane protein [Candidatus Latescibacterota bacterium]
MSPGRWRVLALVLLSSQAAGSAPAAASGASLDSLAGRTLCRVEFAGHRATAEHVIRREVRSRVGSPLDPVQVQRDVQRLRDLDIFSSVQADAEPVGEGVALRLRLREIPAVVPYVTYDVTDQDGWSFGPAVKAVNLLGRDIFLAGFALFGGKTSFLLDLNDPWIGGNHVSFDLHVARLERQDELDGFGETSLEVRPYVGTYLGERGRAAVGVTYLRLRASPPDAALSANGVDHLLAVGMGLGWDSRDSWGNPHRGWQNEVHAIRTGGPLPGGADYWTVHLDARRFQPVLSHTLVLSGLLSLQSGRLDRSLPRYMDFHLGGSNSLRGYRLTDLGAVLSGKNQWLGTLEERFPLLPEGEVTLLGLSANLGLSGAVFLDHGLAWSRRGELDLDRARTGLGVGLRLLMPAIEMTRLDLGLGADGQWHIHLAGYSKMTAQRQRLR